MVDIFYILESRGISVAPLVRTIIILLVLFIVFSVILGITKRYLLRHVKGKEHKTNVVNFSRLFKIVVFLILVIVGAFSYAGSFAGLGIAAGLLTAALGWALQRPITGVAAWIMVIFKRPFSIGDRIFIGQVKGDVKEITLTHIVLAEVGGLVNAEALSGRTIMVPNYQLYEQDIINYTQDHEFILGEVIAQVTYESNLDKAIRIAFKTAKKYTEEGSKKMKREPMIRVSLAASGVDIKVRFYADTHGIQKVKSDISKEIYDKIKKEHDIEIAYPHTEILFKDKKLFKKK